MVKLTPEQFHYVHKGWNNKLMLCKNGAVLDLTLGQFTIRFLKDNKSFDMDGKPYKLENGFIVQA
jgi:hypothetical protein